MSSIKFFATLDTKKFKETISILDVDNEDISENEFFTNVTEKYSPSQLREKFIFHAPTSSKAIRLHYLTANGKREIPTSDFIRYCYGGLNLNPIREQLITVKTQGKNPDESKCVDIRTGEWNANEEMDFTEIGKEQEEKFAKNKPKEKQKPKKQTKDTLTPVEHPVLVFTSNMGAQKGPTIAKADLDRIKAKNAAFFKKELNAAAFPSLMSEGTLIDLIKSLEIGICNPKYIELAKLEHHDDKKEKEEKKEPEKKESKKEAAVTKKDAPAAKKEKEVPKKEAEPKKEVKEPESDEEIKIPKRKKPAKKEEVAVELDVELEEEKPTKKAKEAEKVAPVKSEVQNPLKFDASSKLFQELSDQYFLENNTGGADPRTNNNLIKKYIERTGITDKEKQLFIVLYQTCFKPRTTLIPEPIPYSTRLGRMNYFSITSSSSDGTMINKRFFFLNGDYLKEFEKNERKHSLLINLPQHKLQALTKLKTDFFADLAKSGATVQIPSIEDELMKESSYSALFNMFIAFMLMD
jgi:hypothetical protein